MVANNKKQQQKPTNKMQKVPLAWTHVIRIITERKAISRTSLFFVILAIFTSVIASISIYASERAQAAPNDTINFQARLLSNTGALVADGFYTVEFNIYAQESGGTTQWTETQALTAKNGYLSASLGEVTAFGSSIDWSQEQWLTMNVNGDGEMNPRMKITAVPLAFRAVQADSLTTAGGTVTADDLAQLAPAAAQGVNSTNSLLRLNQTGSGGLLQLQSAGTDVLTLSNAGDLDIARGITLGTSTSAVSGTIRWNGADFEGYDGSNWVSLTNNGDVGTFYAYDNAGGTTLSVGSWTDLTLNVQTKVDSQYSHTNGTAPITIEEDGWYEVTYNVSTDSTSGTDRTSSGAKLQINTGGGFADMPGSLGYMYNRQATEGEATVSRTIVYNFSSGDIVKIQAQIISGSNVSTLAGGTSISIKQISASSGGGGGGILSFQNGGNAFNGTAILGTSDNYNLDLITNGTTRLTVSNTGSVDLLNDLTIGTGLTVSGGGADVTGNSTIIGTLSGLTGLTTGGTGLLVTAGGADITGDVDIAGVLDLANNGITNVGDITGVGANLTASGGLTVSSSAGGDITLDSASGTLVLGANTLQSTNSGTTNLELNDSSDTLLNLVNSDGLAVADLSVEGQVTAQSFNGNGSALTSLNASSLSSGTVSDSLLSSNIARLDTSQTFSVLQTLNAGLVLGNTAATNAGAIRFTGTDFEGYDGSQWVSLTSAGAPLLEGVLAFGKVAANGTPIDVDAATITYNGTGSYTVNLNTAATTANYIVQLTVDEDSNTRDDINISLDNQTVNGFDVTIREGDNGATADVLVDKIWHFIVFDSDAAAGGGSGAGGGSAFEQGGNDFGATAILGTTAANDLDIVTNGAVRLTVDAAGSISTVNDVTVGTDLSVTGNTSLDGSLTIGDAATDSLILNSDSLTLNNGLDIDSGTLAIDSANNRVGIGNSAPANTLTINTPSANDSSADVLIATGGINSKGLVIQSIAGQVANLFEAQDSNGNSLLAIDSNGALVLGNDAVSPTEGSLVFNDAIGANGFTSVLGTSSLTANRAISLPDSDGTICLSGEAGCGFVLVAEGSAQLDSTTDNSIFINKTGASGNLVVLQNNGTDVFTVANDGSLALSLNSTAALNILDSGSNPILTVDTINGFVFADELQLNRISGAGLSQCTNSNQALQWDSTTETFSCVDLDIGTTIAHVVDSAGGTDVNTAAGQAIPWGNQTRVDSGFTHNTGVNNTQVTIDEAGWYRVKYSVNTVNGGNGRITARCQIRTNGSTIVVPSSSYSYLRNSTDSNATNIGEAVIQTTATNEYYEVFCDQAGSNGSSNTIVGASWTSVEKL